MCYFLGVVADWNGIKQVIRLNNKIRTYLIYNNSELASSEVRSYTTDTSQGSLLSKAISKFRRRFEGGIARADRGPRKELLRQSYLGI